MDQSNTTHQLGKTGEVYDIPTGRFMDLSYFLIIGVLIAIASIAVTSPSLYLAPDSAERFISKFSEDPFTYSFSLLLAIALIALWLRFLFVKRGYRVDPGRETIQYFFRALWVKRENPPIPFSEVDRLVLKQKIETTDPGVKNKFPLILRLKNGESIELTDTEHHDSALITAQIVSNSLKIDYLDETKIPKATK